MENIIYRYSLTLSYSSAKEGLTEVRIWIYSRDPHLYSKRNLDNFIDDYLDLLGINPHLQRSLSEEFSPEIAVPVSISEMEFSGHQLNKFYGFTEFKRGKTTSKYYNISNNGHYWSRSTPFSSLIPKGLKKWELEKKVMRKFKKPKVIKINKKLWENALREAKRTNDKKLMRKARGKLRWAGKSQVQVKKYMDKIRQKGIRKRATIKNVRTYRSRKEWHKWSKEMNKLRWRKY